MASPTTVFTTALLGGAAWFLVLSFGMGGLVRLMEFRQERLPAMGLRFLIVYVLVTVLCALNAMYLYVREAIFTEEGAWMSVFTALLIWSVLLVVTELFVLRPSDQ